MKRLLVALALVVVLLALGLAALVGFSSRSKEDLAARLLALAKNAPLARQGVERVPLRFPSDGGERILEATYVHVPARSAQAGARPPLVLVHGTPGSLFGWSEAVFGKDGSSEEGLAWDADVWILDVVGHGVTPPLDGATTFQRCADWIAAFLEAQGLADVTLVGHSYGGEFAWRAALDHPERIARLVLVDSAGIPREEDEWLPEEKAMRSLALAPYGYVLNSRARVAPALQMHFAAPLADERIEEMKLLLDNASNWRAMVELARDENGSRVEELARLSQPTLLLWGADDQAYSVARFAAEFERRIPQSVLVTLPGLGHYPHEEAPAAFVAALRAWLESSAPSER